MARRRYNFDAGTVDTDLAIGGLTLSSPELANLPAVTGSDYVVVTLDPDKVAGAPEIAYITAHTASATTATITRAHEGTTARAHLTGIKWRHVATVLDFEDELVDDTTLEVASGQHRIKDGGVSTAKIAANAVTPAKIPAGQRFTKVANLAALNALTPTAGDLAFQNDADRYFGWDGAEWVPIGGIMPYVECTNTSAISFVSNVTHALTFDTEVRDTHAAFSAGVFTAPYAGVYLISFEWQADHTDADLWRMGFVRNSEPVFNCGRLIPSALLNVETAVLSFSRAFHLAAGDTLYAAASCSSSKSALANAWISIAYLHP